MCSVLIVGNIKEEGIYRTSRSAVRSSSLGWPAMRWNVVTAVAKSVVISSGVIVLTLARDVLLMVVSDLER